MPFNSPAAILFDIDGTLMDDDRAVLLALVSFHAIYGRRLGISADDLITRWKELLNIHFGRYLACEISMQQQRRARVLDLFAASNINLSPETADRVFAAYESAYCASWTAYPDALPTLKALNGYVLAILSNGDLAQQTRKLEVCGAASHFVGIFVSSEMGCSKPAPEAFLRACQRLDIPPQRCMYVGDNLETDLRGSTSAGLMGVWLDRAHSGTDPGPETHVIHNLSELPALICLQGKKSN
jgi:putative hydrolase of the HAD superfamily